MPSINLKSVSAGLVLIVFFVFFVPDSFAAAISLKPHYHHKADNFYLKGEINMRSPVDPRQSGIILARLSEKEGHIRTSYPAELKPDTVKKAEPVREKEKAVDFTKIINEMWGDKSSEGYLYWDDGDLAGQINKTYRWHYGKYKDISEQTTYMTFIHIAAAGILYLMPESVTKWDKSTMSFSTVTDKWKLDVKAGPVWDKDDWVINYIGHTYQGAAYYVVARHSGFDWKGAFLFSTICSTFMWEYGFESFAEVPSIQDLIVTPIAGSLLGELLLHGEETIMENDGKVLGSKMLGKISLVLIDPAGSMIRSLKGWIEWPSSIKARTEFFYEPLSMFNPGSPMDQLSDPDSRYGMRLVFTYE